LVVLLAVPDRRPVAATGADDPPASFRTVGRDQTFVVLVAANVGMTIVGYSLFSNILPPFAKSQTTVGPHAIGILFLINTAFIVIVQLPATRVVKRLRRTHTLGLIGALWAVACLAVLPASAFAHRSRRSSSPGSRSRSRLVSALTSSSSALSSPTWLHPVCSAATCR
jgi:Na+/melibiose symporter-like transporter